MTSVRTLLLLATAAALSGCMISTELGPEGFQGGRRSVSNTGTNLKPRDAVDASNVKALAPEDIARLQQKHPGKAGF
jgi:hypothetical protein